MTGPKTVERTTIRCPNCGAPVTLRTFANASRVICEYCDSLIDNSNEGLAIVEQYRKRVKIKPKIPLGSRGQFENRTFEVVGFMQRRADDFQWDEYVLFNPYYGFRYLAESDRHWNFITPMAVALLPKGTSYHPTITHDGLTYRKFATYEAEVTYVLGEFPWRVQAGETVLCTDYISVPYVISQERAQSEDGAEIAYSKGAYMEASEVFSAFDLKAPTEAPKGVAPNQPNPLEAVWAETKKLALMVFGVFLLVSLLYIVRSSGEKIFAEEFSIAPPRREGGPLKAGTSEPKALKPFEVTGGTRNLQLVLSTSVRNSWVLVTGNLVNTETEQSYPFAADIEYRSGVYAGESWTEGSRSQTLLLGGIPSGRYRLVVETKYDSEDLNLGMGIQIYRDVWLLRYILIPFLFVISFPLVQWLRYQSFETRRWAGSDLGDDGDDEYEDDEYHEYEDDDSFERR